MLQKLHRAFRSRRSFEVNARAIIAATLLSTGSALAADPVFGTWTWDAAHSHAESADDTCYVTALEDLGNGKFRETTTRVRSNGEVIRQDTISAFDGGDHPNGLDGTTAFTRIDAQRYVMVYKERGKAFSTAVRTISADGNTMTHVGDGTVKGKAFHDALVFERKDSTCETPNHKQP